MNDFRIFDLTKVPLEGGAFLIEASAGTGKTYNIANLFLRLALEKEMEVGKILVVTYTEAATDELKNRIRENLIKACAPAGGGDALLNDIIEKSRSIHGEEKTTALMRRAIVNFDEAAIFTIHGFFKKVLSENSFESSITFDTELVADQEDIIKETVDDFWRKNFTASPPLLAAEMKKHNLDRAALLRFAETLISKPLIRLFPDKSAIDGNTLAGIFEDIRREWKKHRGEIKEIFDNSAKLKMSQSKDLYKDTARKIYLAHMDICSDSMPSSEAVASIRMFASSTIAGAIMQGRSKERILAPEHPFFELCEKFIRAEKEYIVNVKIQFHKFITEEFYRKKTDSNVQSFDDLQLNLYKALKSGGGNRLAGAIREKYVSVLIDEFQDTDPMQYSIFNSVFGDGGTPLFFIGDPKQSIYEFRGADIFSYMNVSENIAEANRYTLSTNWRSEEGLVNAVNSVFGSIRNPFVLGHSISYNPASASPESKGNKAPLSTDGNDNENMLVWFLENRDEKRKYISREKAGERAVKAVACEISRLLNLSDSGRAVIGGRPLVLSDIAILSTQHDEARAMKKALDRINIPSTVQKIGNVFHSPEAAEMRRFLHAVSCPGNIIYLNTALSGPFFGIDAEALSELLENEEKHEQYEDIIRNFSEYSEIWNSRGFISMFRQFMRGYGIRAKLLSLPEGERKLTNTLHLAELIHQAAVNNSFGVNGVLDWLSEKMNDTAAPEENELRLERDEKAVQIITVFKSKGLEYPLVFCPFMWRKSIDGRENGDYVFHENSETFMNIMPSEENSRLLNLSLKERLSEYMRLLYVALTRARNRVYLVCGKIGKKSLSSLDYLYSGTDGKTDVDELLDNTDGLEENELFSRIGRLAEDAGQCMKIAKAPDIETMPYIPISENTPDLSVREFHGAVASDNGIASFSFLSAGESTGHFSESGKDIGDEADSAMPDEMNPEEIQNGFFLFPKGPAAGRCVHSIFEKMDFSATDKSALSELVSEILVLHGMGASSSENLLYEGYVHEMLKNVLNSKLDGFTLRDIKNDDRVNELEFYYPLRKISPETLSALFREIPSFENSEFPSRLEELDFSPVQGYMHGFIDMLFTHAGKYYIVDWKTNHLGKSFDYYSIRNIRKNMEASCYILQYYIYTLAVHKYLGSRITDYDYARDFGGVFYLYVRGMCPGLKDSGIFYDKPCFEAIQKMNSTLCP